jgi:serine/threonine protein phosphatase PrpC
VSAIPDVKVQQINSADQFVILASDGVWDFMSNQEVCDVAASNQDPREASRAIVSIARERWKKNGGGQYVDDVTALVARLN